MPDKYKITLYSTSRVYHITNEYRALLCKVLVHGQELHGVFIDGELPHQLGKAIRVWATKNLIQCPDRFVALGRIKALDTWPP